MQALNQAIGHHFRHSTSLKLENKIHVKQLELMAKKSVNITYSIQGYFTKFNVPSKCLNIYFMISFVQAVSLQT